MAAEIRIPKLGMSITEIEAQDTGVLRVTGEEGEAYKIGDVIGTIG